MRQLIYNATLVKDQCLTRGAWVMTDGDRISHMGQGEVPADLMAATDVAIDAHGDYLLPGVIDEHVHLREPGLTHKGDIHSETCAAVAGGVTSVMDMPNVTPPTVTIDNWNHKMERAAQSSLCNYSFYLGATASNLDQLLAADYSKVCGVKVFMGSSTGGMLVDDQDALYRIFAQTPAIIAVHCEDESIIQANRRQYIQAHGPIIPPQDHPSVRSREACRRSTLRAITLARETHARLHVLHLTTADELALLDGGPLDNKRITAEACVGHLWFSDQDYERLGNRIRVNPAVKTAADRQALRQAVKSGLIDTIATDHAPHLWSEKSENLLNVPSGMPLAQFSLLAMLELCYQGVFTLQEIVNAMCSNPALIYGIDRRGEIKEGFYADLVQVHPEPDGWTVTDQDVLSRCQWTPLDGTTFHHRVARTWVNGRLAYDRGRVDDGVRGMALSFNNL